MWSTGIVQATKIDCTSKWYMQNPESVLENETNKILWDSEIQTDHPILGRQPNLEIIHKKKKKELAELWTLLYRLTPEQNWNGVKRRISTLTF